MKSKNQSVKKKKYHPPRLVVYGDIHRLTMAKGGTKFDGGGKPQTRATGMQA